MDIHGKCLSYINQVFYLMLDDAVRLDRFLYSKFIEHMHILVCVPKLCLHGKSSLENHSNNYV